MRCHNIVVGVEVCVCVCVCVCVSVWERVCKPAQSLQQNSNFSSALHTIQTETPTAITLGHLLPVKLAKLVYSAQIYFGIN